MGEYTQLDGMRLWFDEQGEGEALVLLHPGMVDSRAWGPNLDGLAAHYRTFTPDRRGHGHTPDVDGPISYEIMAQDTITFIERVVGGAAHIVGCSDGAIVGLMAALLRPDLVRRLVSVAGVFHRDGWAPETIGALADVPDFMADLHAEVSPDGADHFPVLVEKLGRMHGEEPALTAGDLKKLTPRTLVMVGDDDEVILEHAVEFYRSVPDAELAVVPGTSHGLLVEKPELCNRIIVDFLANDPVPTVAPIRRATSPVDSH